MVLDVVDVLRVEVPVLRQRVVGHHLEPGERLEAVLRGEARHRVDVGVPGLGSNSIGKILARKSYRVTHLLR